MSAGGRKSDAAAVATAYSRACGHCGKQPAASGEALLCGGCRSEYYCNSICQKAGWKAGHKQECKRRQAKLQEVLGRRETFNSGFNQIAEYVRSVTPASCPIIDDVPTPEQPPLVPGGPVIHAGGGRNWKYKADTPDVHALLLGAVGEPLVLKALLERGEDVHTRGPNGGTALTFAAAYAATNSESLQCIDVLLGHGADPNAADCYGMTAAHRCVTAPITVSYYVEAFVETSVVTHAMEASLRRLLDAGADLSLVDVNGNAPSASAARGSPIAQLLQRLRSSTLRSGRRGSSRC